MEEVARIVLALETPDVAEEVMHFLDRTGRARVVGTAVDAAQARGGRSPARARRGGRRPLARSRARDAERLRALLAVDEPIGGALRRAIRGGASGFYLWPAEREELALAAARVGPKPDETSGERAQALAVYAPRGGAGGTFVATHLAAAFAKRDRRCILIDLDVLFADASAALGVPADEEIRTIADLVPLGDEVASQHVEELVWRHPAGFAALLAPGDRQRFPRIGAEAYGAATAARRSCDVVVLHVPRALDEVARRGSGMRIVLVVLGLDCSRSETRASAIEVAALEGRCVRGQQGEQIGDHAERRRTRLRATADRRDPVGSRRRSSPGSRSSGADARTDRTGARQARPAGAGGIVNRMDALKDVRRTVHERLIGRVDARQLDAMPRPSAGCGYGRRRSRSCGSRATCCRRARSRMS